MNKALTYWDPEVQAYRRVQPLSMQHNGTDWIMLAHDMINHRTIQVNLSKMADVIGRPTLELRLVT